jgi:flavin-dependent dehydrogenase
MQDVFDVAIIGGGLGGLTLSLSMVRLGYKVILFEKNKYPFHKVCGEYISLESYDFLERLGIPLKEYDLPIITKMKITSVNGSYISSDLDLGALGVSRYFLDHKLSEKAKSLGVEVKDNTKVNDVYKEDNLFKVQTDDSIFTSKLVVGSFGKHSNLDLKLNRKKKESKHFVGVKYHIKTDFPNNKIELHNFKGGYCGISKIEEDKYCLCYLTDSENLKQNNNDIKKTEENILFRNKNLEQIFSNSEFIFDKPLTISQIQLGKKSLIESDIFLIGDSAGTIAPLSGNGMSIAMRGAFELSKILDLYLTNKISFEESKNLYINVWSRLFYNRIRLGIFLQNLLGKEFITNNVISTLSYFPSITKKLIPLTHGNKF